MFPTRDKLTICFAHAAYQMKARFDARNTGINSFQVRSYDEFVQRVGEADVVSASGKQVGKLAVDDGKRFGIGDV